MLVSRSRKDGRLFEAGIRQTGGKWEFISQTRNVNDAMTQASPKVVSLANSGEADELLALLLEDTEGWTPEKVPVDLIDKWIGKDSRSGYSIYASIEGGVSPALLEDAAGVADRVAKALTGGTLTVQFEASAYGGTVWFRPGGDGVDMDPDGVLGFGFVPDTEAQLVTETIREKWLNGTLPSRWLTREGKGKLALETGGGMVDLVVRSFLVYLIRNGASLRFSCDREVVGRVFLSRPAMLADFDWFDSFESVRGLLEEFGLVRRPVKGAGRFA